MSTRTEDRHGLASRTVRKWIARATAVLLVASGITIAAQPEPAEASIDVGSASQDCTGLVTFSGSTLGVSLGYTLSAYAGRTVAEVESAQYLMGRSTTPWPISMVTASVSGTWQSPWVGEDLVVGIVPHSFPWGSFALNFADRLSAPFPADCPVSVGDYAWTDTNRNGVQDSGEPAVPGVAVQLLDAFGTPIKSTTTNANGFYSFTDLVGGGSYSVRFTAPTGRVFTQAGAGGDRGRDSNPNTSGVASFTAPKGGRNSASSPDDPTIDVGFVPQIDLALTKTLTSTGPFQPGQTVAYTLIPKNNGPGSALGGWSVTEVHPAGLSIVSMSGSGYTCSGNTCTNAAPLAAGASAGPITVTAKLGADAKGTIRNVAYVSPAPGDVPETNPLGTPPGPGTITGDTPTNNDADVPLNVVPRTSIGDTVWEDTDRDGVQDPGEPGIPGVSVKLIDGSGATVGNTTTDAKGFYVFSNLPPSTAYTVEFVAPAGYSPTRQAVGTDRAKDSNPGANGRAPVTAPASGANSATTPDDPTIDAGFVRNRVSIGDHVWLDQDRDGVQDAGETPAPGVRVRLLDAAGAELRSTTTNAAGFYSFTDLDGAAKYTVAFTAPDGYSFTRQAAGTDRAKDSNPGMAGKAAVTAPASGANSATTPDDPTIDAGFVRNRVSIGDHVWFDQDRDGVQDAGETPAPGVRVRLLDAAGAELRSTTTNAAGFYSFTDLDGAADYTVAFTAPIGYAFTTRTVGTDRAKDSNPGTEGKAPVTAPASGANSATAPDDPTIDAGLISAAGTLSWKKVDPQGAALRGSEWTLTAKSPAGAPTGTVIAITDCVAAAPAGCTGPDRDPAPGGFAVTDLRFGDYELAETRAPAGYRLLEAPIPVTISSATTLLSDIENQLQDVPAIPLTGGLGADGYRIAGGLLVLLMLGLAGGELARRRRRSA